MGGIVVVGGCLWYFGGGCVIFFVFIVIGVVGCWYCGGVVGFWFEEFLGSFYGCGDGVGLESGWVDFVLCLG